MQTTEAIEEKLLTGLASHLVDSPARRSSIKAFFGSILTVIAMGILAIAYALFIILFVVTLVQLRLFRFGRAVGE